MYTSGAKPSATVYAWEEGGQAEQEGAQSKEERYAGVLAARIAESRRKAREDAEREALPSITTKSHRFEVCSVRSVATPNGGHYMEWSVTCEVRTQ